MLPLVQMYAAVADSVSMDVCHLCASRLLTSTQWLNDIGVRDGGQGVS